MGPASPALFPAVYFGFFVIVRLFVLNLGPRVVKNNIFSHALVTVLVVVKRRIVKHCIFSHAVTSFVLWSRPCVFGRGILP